MSGIDGGDRPGEVAAPFQFNRVELVLQRGEKLGLPAAIVRRVGTHEYLRHVEVSELRGDSEVVFDDRAIV